MTGYAHLAAWWLIAGVLLVSAASKLHSRRALRAFADSVAGARLVRPALVRPVAVTVVLAEASAVALLAFPPLARAGLVLAAGLLVALTAAVAVSLGRGIRAPCRCFGGSARPFGAAHLVRNGLLLAIVTFALWSSPPAGYEAAGVAVSAFAALSGTMVMVFFVDFTALFRTPAPAPGAAPQASERTPA